jgi:hypothetical protein
LTCSDNHGEDLRGLPLLDRKQRLQKDGWRIDGHSRFIPGEA